jgi:hypothetical protein
MGDVYWWGRIGAVATGGAPDQSGDNRREACRVNGQGCTDQRRRVRMGPVGWLARLDHKVEVMDPLVYIG